MKKILSEKYLIWIVAVISGLIAVWSFSAGLFKGVEFFLEDILVFERPVNEQIVIVAIDNDSLEKIGQWPWPRAVFADALSKLNEKSPKVVGIDLVFAEPSGLGADDDLKLSNFLKNSNYPIILPIEALDLSIKSNGEAFSTKNISALESFRNNKNVFLAHVNLIIDPDGIVRHIPLTIKDLNSSFGFSEISAFSKVIASKVVGEENFLNRENVSRIVYSQKPGSVRRVPFWRLLSDKDVVKSLEGKTVLIGVTSPDLHDENLVPTSKGIAMPGVEIQANILNMLLNNYRLVEPTNTVTNIILFLVAILSIIPFILFRRFIFILLINIVLLILYLSVVIIVFESGIALSLVHILIAWFVTNILAYSLRYFLSERDRRELKFAFSKYVSKAVLDEILLNPSKIKLGGEERSATVLFSDIRGFTTLSESMSPAELTKYLNRYLTIMTDIVLDGRGVIDKYIGDAIMAFWGAPVEDENHAFDALKSAIKMQLSLVSFNEENLKLNEPEIAIGIGLNSGKVVAGNMGSSQRFDYTVMGDTVNLASRIESLTKMYGAGIIVSESVIKEIGLEKIQSLDVLVRELDRVMVKGKKQGVSIFEIIYNKKSFPIEAVNLYSEMLSSYYKGDWKQAIKYAEKVLEVKKGDLATLEIKKRLESFIANPPSNWTGVYELKNK